MLLLPDFVRTIADSQNDESEFFPNRLGSSTDAQHSLSFHRQSNAWFVELRMEEFGRYGEFFSKGEISLRVER